MQQEARINPFSRSKELWKATLTMVKQMPEFILKPAVLQEAEQAGRDYVNAVGEDKVQQAGEKLYRANCAIRNMFAAYMRTLFGGFNQELKEFLDRERPSQEIQKRCQQALDAFHDALFHEERSEKGIKTFAMRLSTHQQFVKTLTEARAEHARNLESLRKLEQKRAAGIPMGAREQAKLAQHNLRPSVQAEKARAQAAAETETRRQEQLAKLKKQREAEVADLMSV